MRNVLILALLALVGIFALVSGYLYFSQDRMIFMPSAEIAVSPADINMVFVEFNLEVEPGVTVNGWYIPGADGTRTVMLCHGNAGNISHRLETARFLQQFGVAVVLFDYRGYGKSTGKPTEQGVYDDAAAVYRWLTEDQSIAPDNIILFGRSLGGAVAVQLATEVDCGDLVVESSFTSAAELGQAMFPFVPVKWLLKYRFDSALRIADVRCPVVVAHSPDDEMIPFVMGQRLFEKAPEPKDFVELMGGHNELEYFESEQYIDLWRRLATGGRTGLMVDGGV